MKFFLAPIFFLSFIFESRSQKLDETFNPIIKITPQIIKIVQSSDDNYLIYGDIDYYGEALSGSLIKIDQLGNVVEEFQKVYTDRTIETVIVLPSGKILISGGFRYLNGEPVGGSALLHADGSIDHGFSIEEGEWVRILGVQSSGKPIGITSKTLPYTKIVRLHPDGTFDASFSTDLSVTLFRSLAVSDDDEIYIADLDRVHRLSKDGAIDHAYNFPVSPIRTVNSLAFHDGKLVASVTNASSFTPPFTETYTIERFNADGTIDNTFIAGNANARIDFIAVRENGQIVITGYFTTFDSNYGSCIELNANGSFNHIIFNADFNGIYYMYKDNAENIFVTGGFRQINGINYKHVVKIKPTDELDESFRIRAFGVRGNPFNSPLTAQSNDKLIIGGGSNFHGAGSNTSKLVRVFPDGSTDSQFQPAITEHPFYNGFVNAIAVQEDDKIIVGGGNLFETEMTTLRRFLPNGQQDYSFQIGSGPSDSRGYRPGTQFIKIRDSKIYILGYFDRFNNTVCKNFVILNMDGNRIGPEHNMLPDNSSFTDMEIQSDGKVILMGSFQLSETDTRHFLRLNSDGSIDNTFNLHVLKGNKIDLEIDDRDNILVTGNSLDLKANKILTRFSPDGDIDESFELGSGFMPSNQYFISGYSVKALKNDMIAVTGLFSGYQNTISPGLVIMDYNGSVIPFVNSFDLTSYGYTSTYANNTLYILGRFSNKGTEIFSGLKMHFPNERVATGFKATAISASSIELSWNAVKPDQFIIERSSTPQPNYEVIATIPSETKIYEVKNLDEVTPYYFRIRSASTLPSDPALYEGSDTTWIQPQVALPASDITSNSFVANWIYIPGTDSCLLQVSEDNFGGFVDGHENLILTEGSKFIGGLKDGKIYQYRIKRFKNNKSSSFSEIVTANIITEIEESPLKVNVYPNPFSNYLSIDLPENAAAKVVVHSTSGETVAQYALVNNGPSEIDVRNLPRGIFILTISSNGKSKRFKLVRSE